MLQIINRLSLNEARVGYIPRVTLQADDKTTLGFSPGEVGQRVSTLGVVGVLKSSFSNESNFVTSSEHGIFEHRV